MGCLRRADADFGMIQNGDRIAVGVSGGKDSLALVYCLELYKRFSKKDYEICAVTVDTGLRPFDLSGVREFMARLGVPYEVIETNAGEVVFSLRQEKNPCALCANLRRGTMNNAALRLGCNKTALGHHSEDAVDTLLMSIFYEGRLNTFQPVTELFQMRAYRSAPPCVCFSGGYNIPCKGAAPAGGALALPRLRQNGACKGGKNTGYSGDGDTRCAPKAKVCA